MTFVILTGGIDLSVGSVVGLTAMIAGLLINEGLAASALGVVLYPHTWMVMVISLAAGVLVGAINGWIITQFNVAPFIATLGMLYVARGAAGLLNNGNTFPNLVGRPELGNTGYAELGTGGLLGISWAIWIMIAFAIVAWFVTTRTPFGRAVYAVGGNERSAELSGRAREAHQDARLHDQRLLRRDRGPDHLLAARGRASRHGRRSSS